MPNIIRRVTAWIFFAATEILWQHSVLRNRMVLVSQHKISGHRNKISQFQESLVSHIKKKTMRISFKQI
jgi:hypothetical protein